MSTGCLPRSLCVQGREWRIRTDFRAVLDILVAMEDGELTEQEKAYVMLYILFPDFTRMRHEDYEEAMRQASWFIDCGAQHEDQRAKPRQISWRQDENIIFPSVNKAAGKEVRSVKYMHWWTFMGYFMEIGEGTFSTVLSIRQKRMKHQKLEKYEQEFYRNNKKMCDLYVPMTEEEQEENDSIIDLIG